MASVHYDFPVKCVHGKLNKDDKVSFAKRSDTGTTYGVKRDDWSVKYKTAETRAAAETRQAKFRAVVTATKERMQDPTKQPIDKAGFAAQTKYKTLWGYCFKLEWLAFDD